MYAPKGYDSDSSDPETITPPPSPKLQTKPHFSFRSLLPTSGSLFPRKLSRRNSQTSAKSKHEYRRQNTPRSPTPPLGKKSVRWGPDEELSPQTRLRQRALGLFVSPEASPSSTDPSPTDVQGQVRPEQNEGEEVRNDVGEEVLVLLRRLIADNASRREEVTTNLTEPSNLPYLNTETEPSDPNESQPRPSLRPPTPGPPKVDETPLKEVEKPVKSDKKDRKEKKKPEPLHVVNPDTGPHTPNLPPTDGKQHDLNEEYFDSSHPAPSQRPSSHPHQYRPQIDPYTNTHPHPTSLTWPEAHPTPSTTPSHLSQRQDPGYSTHPHTAPPWQNTSQSNHPIDHHIPSPNPYPNQQDLSQMVHGSPFHPNQPPYGVYPQLPPWQYPQYNPRHDSSSSTNRNSNGYQTQPPPIYPHPPALQPWQPYYPPAYYHPLPIPYPVNGGRRSSKGGSPMWSPLANPWELPSSTSESSPTEEDSPSRRRRRQRNVNNPKPTQPSKQSRERRERHRDGRKEEFVSEQSQSETARDAPKASREIGKDGRGSDKEWKKGIDSDIGVPVNDRIMSRKRSEPKSLPPQGTKEIEASTQRIPALYTDDRQGQKRVEQSPPTRPSEERPITSESPPIKQEHEKEQRGSNKDLVERERDKAMPRSPPHQTSEEQLACLKRKQSKLSETQSSKSPAPQPSSLDERERSRVADMNLKHRVKEVATGKEGSDNDVTAPRKAKERPEQGKQLTEPTEQEKAAYLRKKEEAKRKMADQAGPTGSDEPTSEVKDKGEEKQMTKEERETYLKKKEETKLMMAPQRTVSDEATNNAKSKGREREMTEEQKEAYMRRKVEAKDMIARQAGSMRSNDAMDRQMEMTKEQKEAYMRKKAEAQRMTAQQPRMAPDKPAVGELDRGKQAEITEMEKQAYLTKNERARDMMLEGTDKPDESSQSEVKNRSKERQMTKEEKEAYLRKKEEAKRILAQKETGDGVSEPDSHGHITPGRTDNKIKSKQGGEDTGNSGTKLGNHVPQSDKLSEKARMSEQDPRLKGMTPEQRKQYERYLAAKRAKEGGKLGTGADSAGQTRDRESLKTDTKALGKEGYEQGIRRELGPDSKNKETEESVGQEKQTRQETRDQDVTISQGKQTRREKDGQESRKKPGEVRRDDSPDEISPGVSNDKIEERPGSLPGVRPEQTKPVKGKEKERPGREEGDENERRKRDKMEAYLLAKKNDMKEVEREDSASIPPGKDWRREDYLESEKKKKEEAYIAAKAEASKSGGGGGSPATEPNQAELVKQGDDPERNERDPKEVMESLKTKDSGGESETPEGAEVIQARETSESRSDAPEDLERRKKEKMKAYLEAKQKAEADRVTRDGASTFPREGMKEADIQELERRKREKMEAYLAAKNANSQAIPTEASEDRQYGNVGDLTRDQNDQEKRKKEKMDAYLAAKGSKSGKISPGSEEIHSQAKNLDSQGPQEAEMEERKKAKMAAYLAAKSKGATTLGSPSTVDASDGDPKIDTHKVKERDLDGRDDDGKTKVSPRAQGGDSEGKDKTKMQQMKRKKMEEYLALKALKDKQSSRTQGAKTIEKDNMAKLSEEDRGKEKLKEEKMKAYLAAKAMKAREADTTVPLSSRSLRKEEYSSQAPKKPFPEQNDLAASGEIANLESPKSPKNIEENVPNNSQIREKETLQREQMKDHMRAVGESPSDIASKAGVTPEHTFKEVSDQQSDSFRDVPQKSRELQAKQDGSRGQGQQRTRIDPDSLTDEQRRRLDERRKAHEAAIRSTSHRQSKEKRGSTSPPPAHGVPRQRTEKELSRGSLDPVDVHQAARKAQQARQKGDYLVHGEKASSLGEQGDPTDRIQPTNLVGKSGETGRENTNHRPKSAELYMPGGFHAAPKPAPEESLHGVPGESQDGEKEVTWSKCLISLVTCIDLANSLLADLMASSRSRRGSQDSPILLDILPRLLANMLTQKDLVSAMSSVLGDQHSTSLEEFMKHLGVVQNFLRHVQAQRENTVRTAIIEGRHEDLRTMTQETSSSFQIGSLQALLGYLLSLGDITTPTMMDSLKGLLADWHKNGLSIGSVVRTVMVVKQELDSLRKQKEKESHGHGEGEEMVKKSTGVMSILDQLLGFIAPHNVGDASSKRPEIPTKKEDPPLQTNAPSRPDRSERRGGSDTSGRPPRSAHPDQSYLEEQMKRPEYCGGQQTKRSHPAVAEEETRGEKRGRRLSEVAHKLGDKIHTVLMGPDQDKSSNTEKKSKGHVSKNPNILRPVSNLGLQRISHVEVKAPSPIKFLSSTEASLRSSSHHSSSNKSPAPVKVILPNENAAEHHHQYPLPSLTDQFLHSSPRPHPAHQDWAPLSPIRVSTERRPIKNRRKSDSTASVYSQDSASYSDKPRGRDRQSSSASSGTIESDLEAQELLAKADSGPLPVRRVESHEHGNRKHKPGREEVWAAEDVLGLRKVHRK
ncbi:hypothetical protein M231_05760 [Tremella mesenterica]|uniref:Uncharacterized protein n=1 Tax=Tremella mesenterica TaxID=5217 RepID=A0A4Q1BHB6_TREME|nr:hypothetical protein M231_05760 [Tremella mesenterica]